MRRLDVHERRLGDRRFVARLALIWSGLVSVRRQRNRLAALRGLVQRFDDAHITRAFFA
jgi:hypothetical protein